MSATCALARLRFRTCLSQIKLPQRHFLSSSNFPDSPREQSDFLEHFIKNNKPEDQTVAYFRSKEWTRNIVEDPTYEAIPFYSRHLNKNTNENRFFADVLRTKNTIPHALTLRSNDAKSWGTIVHGSDNQQANPPSELLCLMSLGTDLDSHPSIVHGGFQSVLFDEVAWFLILLHQNAIAQPETRENHFTVSLTTKFLAPVATPSDVLLTARLVKREGRKWWTQHKLMSHSGQVLAKAESFWITGKKS